MSRFSVAFLLLALAGCGSDATKATPGNLLASNDYEQLLGWVPEGTITYLTRDKAHSGVYSAQVNSGIEYAGGFISPLGKISPTARLEKLHLQAWVWLPSQNDKASLVVEVSDPATGKSLFYEAMDLVQATDNKLNQWTKVDKTVTLPATITATSLLKTYLWRGQSTKPVYLDDFQLSKGE